MWGMLPGISSAQIKENFSEQLKKFFTSKFFTLGEIKLKLPLSQSSRQKNMEHLTKCLFSASSYLSEDNSDITFDDPPLPPSQHAFNFVAALATGAQINQCTY